MVSRILLFSTVLSALLSPFVSARSDLEGQQFMAGAITYEGGVQDSAADERADFESRAFFAALANLEFYMRAGIDQNVSRAAPLLSSFVINKKRARDDTKRLFRDFSDELEGYVSISNDVYGYEFSVDRFGPSLQFEGGIQTVDGMTAEFEATMVFRENRWLIWSLDID
ncbi:hypothetical protein [Pelagicoccus mobilis]|uniref:Uncharacterized protein n=1 Tax=Pelagicoccus mobilis TaxID=415221 RepID=A0A934VS87_9BACT|nr:hypothetical protein [Pelagicoccus mobilis]MBK1878254.1 hypothetical protein [Pelagicoccus mobilis]